MMMKKEEQEEAVDRKDSGAATAGGGEGEDGASSSSSSSSAASFLEKGYILLRGVLSQAHIEAMRDEIRLLKMKHTQEGRDPATEACALDVLGDVSIPEASPVRTDRESYIGMRMRIVSELRKRYDCTSNDGKLGYRETTGAKRKRGPGDHVSKSDGSDSHCSPSTNKRKRNQNSAQSSSRSNAQQNGTNASPGSCGLVMDAVFTILPKVCKKILQTSSVFLFNENYIVKPPKTDLNFDWHVDAEEQLGVWYTPGKTQYISAWCALDEMTASNGTLQLCRFGQEDGKAEKILCSPGDCVFFSSALKHCRLTPSSLFPDCSGPNRSNADRRVAYAQYTPKVFKGGSDAEHGSQTPLSFGIPCVRNSVGSL